MNHEQRFVKAVKHQIVALIYLVAITVSLVTVKPAEASLINVDVGCNLALDDPMHSQVCLYIDVFGKHYKACVGG